MVRVRLLWATGRRTYLDVDDDFTGRTIEHPGPHGSTAFHETGEIDVDGFDTYVEAGCGWMRVHVNHVTSAVVATAQGTFAAWAVCEGEARSAGPYHALSSAKAAADLEARCPHCQCARWVSDQTRTVDDRWR